MEVLLILIFAGVALLFFVGHRMAKHRGDRSIDAARHETRRYDAGGGGHGN
jgi:hypothetical protein